MWYGSLRCLSCGGGDVSRRGTDADAVAGCHGTARDEDVLRAAQSSIPTLPGPGPPTRIGPPALTVPLIRTRALVTGLGVAEDERAREDGQFLGAVAGPGDSNPGPHTTTTTTTHAATTTAELHPPGPAGRLASVRVLLVVLEVVEVVVVVAVVVVVGVSGRHAAAATADVHHCRC